MGFFRFIEKLICQKGSKLIRFFLRNIKENTVYLILRLTFCWKELIPHFFNNIERYSSLETKILSKG